VLFNKKYLIKSGMTCESNTKLTHIHNIYKHSITNWPGCYVLF